MSAAALAAALEAVDDDVERALAAGALLGDLAAATVDAKRVRRDAVLALRARGLSHAEVAAALGVSRSRAQQLAEGESRPAGARRAAG